MMSRLYDKTGQASLEALIVLPLLLLLIFTGLISMVSYQGLHSIRYQLQESVVCMQNDSLKNCRQQFFLRTLQKTPFVEIERLQLERKSHKNWGRVQLHFSLLPIQSWELEFSTH